MGKYGNNMTKHAAYNAGAGKAQQAGLCSDCTKPVSSHYALHIAPSAHGARA